MDKYIKGAQLNAQIAIAYKSGESLDRFPLWHAPNVPTLRGAIVMAQAAGLKVTRKMVDVSRRDGVVETRVIVWITGNSTASAGISRDETYGEIVATGLAFRNGVERLICKGRVGYEEI